jgi:hypothetical protein
MKFRQSMLKNFMTCPLQGYFTYIEGLPGKQGSRQTFGSVVHAALEEFNLRGDAQAARKLFLSAWADPSVVGLPQIEVWNRYSTFNGLQTRGLQILDAYTSRMRWEDRSVICAEHTFLVPFGRHEITGTVDLVEVRKNHRGKQLLTVTDFKTGTRKPSVAALAIDPQFTAYIWAISQREFWFGHPGTDFLPVENAEWYWELTQSMPKRGLWIHLWDEGKEIDAGGREDVDFGRLYRLCNEVERAIELKVFVPKLGDHCGYCDYAHDPCPEQPVSAEDWARRTEVDENSWASPIP